MLRARVLPLAPDAVSVASAVAHRPGFALLHEPGGTSFIACDPVEQVRALDPEPTLGLDGERSELGRAPRWIGLLPYDARRGLERSRRSEPDPRPAPDLAEPVWNRYGAVVEVGADVRVVGDDPGRISELAARIAERAPTPSTPRLRLAEPLEPDERHRRRIERALELIARGDLYVVNLARRFRFAVGGHPLELLRLLGGRAPAPWSAALEWDGFGVVSMSPELFLRTEPGGAVQTWPIKGTRPRGADEAADRALRLELDRDPKERAELAMVVDVERNDLGRVAVTGSVRLLGPPAVETHRTVHHRVARVAARLRPDASRAELIEALLPSGSVTGAPKVRAMEVIAELEAHRRGLYCGALGALRHDGSLELAIAIRTLTVRHGVGTYFAGGGIVADSDPAREVEETRWKAVQVLAGL